MPNRLRVSVVDHKSDDVVDHKADDFTILLDALEQGLFTMDDGTEELSGDADWEAGVAIGAGTQTLRISYTTIEGQIHATGFTFIDDGQVTLRGTFATPEPLGVPIWTDMRVDLLGKALLGDTRFDFRGSRGDDEAIGSDFGDRFVMRGGDDSVFGGDGDDLINGRRGNDLLIGGGGDDTILGGGGNDMLVLGDGNTLGRGTANGGAGNDVVVFNSGFWESKGGWGSDIFIVDSFNTTAGGSPNVRVRIRDFDPDDFLVLTDLSVSPETIDPTDETLADLENGTIDDFQWRETPRGVVIQAGDARIILRGVDADDIDLDQILFAEQSAQEAAGLFDSTHGGGELGAPPGGDPYYTIMLENVIGITNGTNSFATWGGDLLDFGSSAGGSPNI